RGAGLEGLRGGGAALDMGNAGTAMRLFMGLLAPQRFDSTLIGDESLMRRPMERVAAPLRLMGAEIKTNAGRPPVQITGGRSLRAIEPAPSRDHTERMLSAFGVEVLRNGAEIAIEGGQSLRGTHIPVPADFSSAAFFLVAGCLAAEHGLLLRNVGVNPTRTGLLELLLQMGADIRVHHAAPASRGAAEPVG